MKVEDYVREDGIGLAALIGNGSVTAAEVQAAALEAIGRVDPHIRAVVGAPFETPLRYDADGRFHGVPFAIKDAVLHAEGVPSSLGTRLLANIPMPADTDLMTAFRRAGLATLARTTTPEFAYSPTSEALAYGAPTHNPWALGHSAGGSSGGSSALVAAGALPWAHANDGGGSIRIPAGWCGLVGLKPSRGRVSIGPDNDTPLGGMGIEFAVTRTVRDCAALLDAVAGPTPGDFIPVPNPAEPFATALQRAPGKLRIALVLDPPNGAPFVDPEILQATRDVAALLEQHGHIVIPSRPPIDPELFTWVNVVYWTSFVALGFAELSKGFGEQAVRDSVEAASLACAEHGARLSAVDLLRADAGRNIISRAFARWFSDFDLVLCPTTAVLPPAHGTIRQNDPSHTGDSWTRAIFDLVPFTPLFNLTGHPAISLPLAMSRDGRPIGVQFVGPAQGEAALLSMAAFLEQAMPWAGRTPRVHASRPGGIAPSAT